MPSVSVTEAKRAFSEFLNRAAFGQERIVITSHSKPKAAMISIRDLRRLEELEAHRVDDIESEDIRANDLQQSEQQTDRLKVLRKAIRLRDAFAFQYGTLTVDLVRAARQEREDRMTSVFVGEDKEAYETDR